MDCFLQDLKPEVEKGIGIADEFYEIVEKIMREEEIDQPETNCEEETDNIHYSKKLKNHHIITEN